MTVFPQKVSYLLNRFFRIKQNGALSSFYDRKAGFTDVSVLGSILYFIYSSNLPVNNDVKTATYTDKTLRS